MDISRNEIEILKIYICRTQTGTIHNLSVAHSYFSKTQYATAISNLLDRICAMSNFEFEKLFKKISVEFNTQVRP